MTHDNEENCDVACNSISGEVQWRLIIVLT